MTSRADSLSWIELVRNEGQLLLWRSANSAWRSTVLAEFEAVSERLPFCKITLVIFLFSVWPISVSSFSLCSRSVKLVCNSVRVLLFNLHFLFAKQ